MNLTVRQQEILDFITQAISHEGRPPTRAEICAKFNFRSPNAAESHLRALAAKGVVQIDKGRARGIRLPGQTGLPVIGTVVPGKPLLAPEHIEKRLPLDPELFNPCADYLLRMRGTSLREAGVLDGDLLAVHCGAEALKGQIAVFLTERGITARILRQKELGTKTEGIAVGLIRQFR